MSQESFARSVRRYVIGGAFALVLTLTSYVVVTQHLLHSVTGIVMVVMWLAALQLIVQLLSFLHLTREAQPYWKSWSFLFTMLMLIVVVVGSLWVMMHLNYRMGMSSESMQEYMIEQNKAGF